MVASDTRKRIEACAMREFLAKGFNGASLRRIVHEAGVTTGAFYKYYPSKEALFEGLAGPCVEHVLRMFDDSYGHFVAQGLSDQTRTMRRTTEELTRQMVDYAYDHHDVMKLVLTASEGTPYADFTHQLALREERSTIEFAALMREQGMHVPELDEEFVHMVSSGLFASAFEIVLHDMERESAHARIRLLRRFYTAGWERILGVSFESPDHDPSPS